MNKAQSCKLVAMPLAMTFAMTFSGPAAAVDTVYKSTARDGSVSYGMYPEALADEVEVLRFGPYATQRLPPVAAPGGAAPQSGCDAIAHAILYALQQQLASLHAALPAHGSQQLPGANGPVIGYGGSVPRHRFQERRPLRRPGNERGMRPPAPREGLRPPREPGGPFPPGERIAPVPDRGHGARPPAGAAPIPRTLPRPIPRSVPPLAAPLVPGFPDFADISSPAASRPTSSPATRRMEPHDRRHTRRTVVQ